MRIWFVNALCRYRIVRFFGFSVRSAIRAFFKGTYKVVDKGVQED